LPAAPLEEALGLLLVAPAVALDDLSPEFRERFGPELLSPALFLQAARLKNGTTKNIASHPFHDIRSPPLWICRSGTLQLSFLASGRAGSTG
jgi:hypothetical protein